MSDEFDYAQLEEITGGDAEFERELLTEYLDSAPMDLARLQAAITSGDAREASERAHALKGASATIGATRLAEIALELEQAGKSGDLTTAPSMLARLEQEFVALAQLLRARFDRAA